MRGFSHSVFLAPLCLCLLGAAALQVATSGARWLGPLILATATWSARALQNASDAARVTGIVTRQDGSPVRGAVIAFSAVTWKSDTVPQATEQAVTGPEGRFALPMPPRDR